MTQAELMVGDKVKYIGEDCEGLYINTKEVYTIKSITGDFLKLEEVTLTHGYYKSSFERIPSEKEVTAAFLREQKWFIRTGNPEKSKLVQEWLFEHGMEWLYGKNVQSGFNEQLLTNTNYMGGHEEHILFSTTCEKTNAKEIKIEFETVVKCVTLPPVKLPESAPKKTEAQLKLEKLETTIAQAAAQIQQLKEIK